MPINLPSKVDVLIAGAGPAGLAAGLALCRSGAEVLMVDCRKKIGHPLRCAGLTSPKFFEELGLAPAKGWIRWHLPHAPGVVINRERVEYETAGILEERGLHVAAAVSVVGVDDYDGAGRAATLARGRERIPVRAGCVIAADGAASLVGRLAGLHVRAGLHRLAACAAYHLSGAEPKRTDTLYVSRLHGGYPLPPYYFWVIPRGARELSVGVVAPAADGSKARFLLDRMMRETDAFSGGRITQTIAGMVPLRRPLKKPLGDGLICVGTAAGLLNPMGAHGLLYAVRSGRLAGEVLRRLDGKPATQSGLAAYGQGVAKDVEAINRDYDAVEPDMIAWEETCLRS